MRHSGASRCEQAARKYLVSKGEGIEKVDLPGIRAMIVIAYASSISGGDRNARQCIDQNLSATCPRLLYWEVAVDLSLRDA